MAIGVAAFIVVGFTLAAAFVIASALATSKEATKLSWHSASQIVRHVQQNMCHIHANMHKHGNRKRATCHHKQQHATKGG